MNVLAKIRKKSIWLYRRHVLHDPFLLEIDRWFRDKGDETFRLDYPLARDSIVFDLGGYHGDFAAAIHKRYGCRVYVFEPMPQFYQMCEKRFLGNDKIICFNYGLSASDGWLDLSLADDESSFISSTSNTVHISAHIRSIVQCIKELGIEKIDLMKINIEGGEFDVIPALIDSGDITRVRYLQVQFHNFVERAAERRLAIRRQLAHTHCEMWNYEFVWESWVLQQQVEI